MDLELLVYSVLAALFAISIHELAHGAVADRLGDPTPRALGRLTLNPLKHLDPIGLIMLVLFRLGWAKPVEVNPLRFKNYRRDIILVALAGPLANLTVACVINLLSSLLIRLPISLSPQYWSALSKLIFVNIQLNITAGSVQPDPTAAIGRFARGGKPLPLKQRLAYERIAPYGPLS